MPLEPVAEVTETMSQESLASTMEGLLLGGNPEIPAPELPVPAEPPTPAPETPPARAADIPLPEPDPDEVKLPIDDIEKPTEEPEPTHDKAGKRIQALKAEIKTEWQPKVNELTEALKQKEARILELEGLSTKVEEYESKAKQLEQEMAVVALERTPEFKREITEPMFEIETDAAKIADKYGITHREVFDVLVVPDDADRRAALKKLTSGLEMDQFDLVDLDTLGKKTQPILKKQDELYANAEKALGEIKVRSERETEAQAAARAEERAKATDIVASRVTKALPFLADIVGKVSDGVKSTSFEAFDVQKQAYYVMAGDVLPKFATEYTKVLAERDTLLDELAAFQKSSPRVSGSLSGNSGEPKRHTDLTTAMLTSLGLA